MCVERFESTNTLLIWNFQAKCVCWLWGKNLEFQKVMALLICLKNAFQVGVRFALGLGWELWLLVMRVVQITPSCLS